jgi:hypothetical protein
VPVAISGNAVTEEIVLAGFSGNVQATIAGARSEI